MTPTVQESRIFDEEITLHELMSMAEDAARLAARQYVGIEWEDIQSAIMEIVCSKPHRFERHLEHKGWLWSVFYAEAIAYCNVQVRSYMHYSGEYFYTPAEVRELLQRAYDSDVDLNEVIHITEAAISVWDLARAFDQLAFREKDLIVRKLQLKERLSATDRKGYYRATEKLADILNRGIADASRARMGHEGPGGRKVVTNAQAMRLTGEEK